MDSGGGAKAVTHCGAFQALKEYGIQPDVVSGISVGALVAALYASGFAPKQMIETFWGLNFFKDTVTLLLQRMEKTGIVKRTRGKEDSRQRIVSLTEKGKAMQERAKHIPECLSNDVALKTGDEEDILKMIPALDKLIDGLKKVEK